MRPGFNFGCSCPGDPKVKKRRTRSWWRSDAFQVDRLLFQGGPFMCGEGGHDCIRKASNFGDRWELLSSWRYSAKGKITLFYTFGFFCYCFYISLLLVSLGYGTRQKEWIISLLRVHHGWNNFLLLCWQSYRNWTCMPGLRLLASCGCCLCWWISDMLRVPLSVQRNWGKWRTSPFSLCSFSSLRVHFFHTREH